MTPLGPRVSFSPASAAVFGLHALQPQLHAEGRQQADHAMHLVHTVNKVAATFQKERH